MEGLRDALSHLLEQGLLTRRQVLGSRLQILDASKRNRNTAVFLEEGPSWFLKRDGGASAAALAREVAGYRQAAAPDVGLAAFLPRAGSLDPASGWIAFEGFPGSRTLREHHARCGRLPRRPMRRLGIALGRLHRVRAGEFREGHGRGPGGPPWILSLHRPDLQLLRESSGANVELVRLIQGAPDIGVQLDELAREWTSETLVHGDLRWDNCLLLPGGHGSAWSRVKIVDWEAAGAGDPAWDVAGLLADALEVWASSIPVAGTAREDFLTPLARHPLAAMQPGLRAFWREYVATSRLGAAAALHRLLRSIRFTGARLLQTTFERMEGSARLTGSAIYTTQLAWNVMRTPGHAAFRLLGLVEPVSSGAP